MTESTFIAKIRTAVRRLLERARSAAELALPIIPQPALAGAGLPASRPLIVFNDGGKGGGKGKGKDDGGDDDDDDDDDDDTVTLSVDEHNRLKQKVSEADKAKRKQDKKIAELEERLESAEHGDDEVKQLTAKVDRLEREKAEATERVTELEGEADKATREREAIEIATREGFKNPARAIRMLSDEDLSDKATAERSLKRLAREEPYLVGKRGQGDVGKGAGDKDDEPDDDRGSDRGGDGDKGSGRNGTGGDEPIGVARIRGAYEEKSAGEGNDDD